MTTDAGLPHLIQTNLPLVDWARVETWAVGPGMPDLNGCYLGQDVWVECKATYGWMVSRVRIPQVAWLERRARAGGRCWVAVRQRGSRRDSLWLLFFKFALSFSFNQAYIRGVQGPWRPWRR
jgi:hypothetical protein